MITRCVRLSIAVTNVVKQPTSLYPVQPRNKSYRDRPPGTHWASISFAASLYVGLRVSGDHAPPRSVRPHFFYPSIRISCIRHYEEQSPQIRNVFTRSRKSRWRDRHARNAKKRHTLILFGAAPKYFGARTTLLYTPVEQAAYNFDNTDEPDETGDGDALVL